MNSQLTLRKIISHPNFSVLCVLFLLFVLPQYGSARFMIGSVSVLTTYVLVLPDQFRSRHGSLIPAYCLVMIFWLIAVIISMMSLLGEIQN